MTDFIVNSKFYLRNSYKFLYTTTKNTYLSKYSQLNYIFQEISKSTCTKNKRKYSKIEKPELYTCRENIAFDTYFQHIRNKMKQLKENR